MNENENNGSNVQLRMGRGISTQMLENVCISVRKQVWIVCELMSQCAVAVRS